MARLLSFFVFRCKTSAKEVNTLFLLSQVMSLTDCRSIALHHTSKLYWEYNFCQFMILFMHSDFFWHFFFFP